jgi:hypothetical protein
MWPWIKRWRDWAMRDLWPMHRIGPQPQALHYSFEKAGLTFDKQPIPWNADAVLVEAAVRLPSSTSRRKSDFELHLPNQPPVPAESLRGEEEDRHRLFFRLPTPAQTSVAELFWKETLLGQVSLPILTRTEFVQRLGVQMPTLCVRIADQTIACQTFVATQCRGLIATALLTSATSLAPIVDLGLHVQLRSERGGPAVDTPIRLSSSQLKSRQALLTVVPRKFPRRIGTWLATWMIDDQPLVTQRIRAISKRHFERSLRVSETRFLLQKTKEGVNLTRQLPPLDDLERVGPCFLVSSREPGMAGLCTLSVNAQVPGSVQAPPLLEQEALITDGPTAFAPGTVEVGELAQVHGFELRLKNHTLGVLPLTPAPTATFTSEGGFKAVTEFSWSSAAEEQLAERLTRLIEGQGNKI